MKEEIEAIINKSQRALNSAGREFKAGDYDYACSRAYYAVFYLLEGVLLLDDKRFTKHREVKRGTGEKKEEEVYLKHLIKVKMDRSKPILKSAAFHIR